MIGTSFPIEQKVILSRMFFCDTRYNSYNLKYLHKSFAFLAKLYQYLQNLMNKKLEHKQCNITTLTIGKLLSCILKLHIFKMKQSITCNQLALNKFQTKFKQQTFLYFHDCKYSTYHNITLAHFRSPGFTTSIKLCRIKI